MHQTSIAIGMAYRIEKEASDEVISKKYKKISFFPT
jgi:hypothetical protein